jgi:hypothetical protein
LLECPTCNPSLTCQGAGMPSAGCAYANLTANAPLKSSYPLRLCLKPRPLIEDHF